MQELDYDDASQEKHLTGVKHFQIYHEEQLLNDHPVFVMLAPQRLLEVVAGLDAALNLRQQRFVGGEGSARCSVQQHKGERDDQQQGRNALEHAAHDVSQHASASLVLDNIHIA